MDKFSEPENDYGRVRDRRDFDPQQVRLKPILPCPYRDFTFTNLTGWRYYPSSRALFQDRLGSGRQIKEPPPTTMTIPDSWTDRPINNEADERALESSRKQFQDLQSKDKAKRPRLDEATAITDDTTTTAASTMATEDLTGDSANFLELIKPIPRLTSTTTTTTTTIATTSAPEPAPHSSGTITPTVAADVVAKATLYTWYGKKPRKVQLTSNEYITWDNGSRTHDLKYTALFICPVTKEVFLAGRHKEGFTKDGHVVWYSNKKDAEHAAAARTMDCWYLRERSSDRFGLEEPYLSGKAPIFPSNHIPPKVLEEIEEVKQQEKPANDFVMPDGKVATPFTVDQVQEEKRQRRSDNSARGNWRRGSNNDSYARQGSNSSYDQRGYGRGGWDNNSRTSIWNKNNGHGNDSYQQQGQGSSYYYNTQGEGTEGYYDNKDQAGGKYNNNQDQTQGNGNFYNNQAQGSARYNQSQTDYYDQTQGNTDYNQDQGSTNNQGQGPGGYYNQGQGSGDYYNSEQGSGDYHSQQQTRGNYCNRRQQENWENTGQGNGNYYNQQRQQNWDNSDNRQQDTQVQPPPEPQQEKNNSTEQNRPPGNGNYGVIW